MFIDKVSVVGEVSIDNGDDGEGFFFSFVNSFFVVGGFVEERVELVVEFGEDFVVEEGYLFEDGSIVVNMRC